MAQQSAPSSLKILIADDSNSDRLLLKTIVEKQGHIPLLASDGLEAVAIFEQNSPDIVLLDALMPNMDGFDTARYIKAHSGDRFIPIIFLTSLSEAGSLARCLEVGGDDFLTKPYNNIILKAKINAFQRMLKMHTTVQKQRDQIEQHNKDLIEDQKAAKSTFDKITDEGALDAPNIRYRMSPIAILNGDVLLAALRPNGNLCVILGDFTGHGIKAAIGAIPLSQTFYSMVAKGFCIQDILIEINRKLKEILPVDIFCCAVMLDMDFRSKRLEVWNGGMPSCYLCHQENHDIETITAEHVPLGILMPQKFSAKTHFYDMQDGDRLLLWSDGILEAENVDGEMFGEQRLKKILQENTDISTVYQDINLALDNFMAQGKRSDDLSIAEIVMVDIQLFAKRGLIANKQYKSIPGEWTLSFVLKPSSLQYSDPLPMLQKVLADLPGIRPHSGELFTVLTELYANALEHGVLQLQSDMKSSTDGFEQYYQQRHTRLAHLHDGFVRFDIDYKAINKASSLSVLVTDSGSGFDISKVMSKITNIKEYSGRGLRLIHAICRSVEYLGTGNQIKVTFEW